MEENMRAHKRSDRKHGLLEVLKDAIENISDAKDKRTSECMVVMVAALEVGADVDRLVEYTGYPREFIETISRRMRRARLWVGELVDDREWWDERENLTSGFLAHALVAQGQLIRVGRQGGGCRYLDPKTGEVTREIVPPVVAVD
jgi:hypothetical protein